ncbi:MAG: putative DNA modification/repair radical SAM protein [Endomicrobiia bacterium]
MTKQDSLYKLSILSTAARYDNSCSSSGAKRESHPFGIGNTHLSGICHSWTADGRCVSLLKVLLTNMCENDCKYCVCRIKNNLPRAMFTPREIADLTIEFYKRNFIEGLFLSSAVYKSPDYTMELMIKAAEILRKEYHFNGYIHLKILPGTSKELIEKSFELADRVSSNLEFPTKEGFSLLAPQKDFEELLKPLVHVRNIYLEKNKKSPASTQLIVGATNDKDIKFVTLANYLYEKKLVRRVYYSAYIPVNNDKYLPHVKSPQFLREHRLYQADWLIRFYKFKPEEILGNEENLRLDLDPKMSWALRNIDKFPIEITTADYYELIRIPGIGPKGAMKIIHARKYSHIAEKDLKRIGISLKRAKFFITIHGKRISGTTDKDIKKLEKETHLFDNLYKYEENTML